jgi:hypothetical protein
VKTPRNVCGPELLKALRALGYERIRQDGLNGRQRRIAPRGRIGVRNAVFDRPDGQDGER